MRELNTFDDDKSLRVAGRVAAVEFLSEHAISMGIPFNRGPWENYKGEDFIGVNGYNLVPMIDAVVLEVAVRMQKEPEQEPEPRRWPAFGDIIRILGSTACMVAIYYMGKNS